MTASTSARASQLEIVLGPDGQLTLPAWAREALGIEEGDRLTLAVSKAGLVMTPSNSVAFQALREIREAFAEAGITEEELQEEGRRVREELSEARYGRR